MHKLHKNIKNDKNHNKQMYDIFTKSQKTANNFPKKHFKVYKSHNIICLKFIKISAQNYNKLQKFQKYI